MLEPVTVLLELVFLSVTPSGDLGVAAAELGVASVARDEACVLGDLVRFGWRWRLSGIVRSIC